MLYFYLTLASLAAVTHGHALVNSPAVRVPGPKHLEVCGQASFDRLQLDPSGHIEEQLPLATDACQLELCRGMLFEDQPASSIQRVAPGEQMAMTVDCTIPHGGPANVTLLDTTGGGHGRVIGTFLKTFDDFCPTTGVIPADQSNLQFTLPSAAQIGSSCQTDGQCVVQLFWATPDLSQNYYYCVDVTVEAPPPVQSSPPVQSTAVPPVQSSAPPVASSVPPVQSSAPPVVQRPAPPVQSSAPPVVVSTAPAQQVPASPATTPEPSASSEAPQRMTTAFSAAPSVNRVPQAVSQVPGAARNLEGAAPARALFSPLILLAAVPFMLM